MLGPVKQRYSWCFSSVFFFSFFFQFIYHVVYIQGHEYNLLGTHFHTQLSAKFRFNFQKIKNLNLKFCISNSSNTKKSEYLVQMCVYNIVLSGFA